MSKVFTECEDCKVELMITNNGDQILLIEGILCPICKQKIYGTFHPPVNESMEEV